MPHADLLALVRAVTGARVLGRDCKTHHRKLAHASADRMAVAMKRHISLPR